MSDEQGAIPEGMKAGDAAYACASDASCICYPGINQAAERAAFCAGAAYNADGSLPADDRLTDTGEGLPTDRYGMTVLDRMRDAAENGTMPPEYRKDLFALLDLATPKPPVDAGTFKRGDRVEKISGSSWRGIVAGEYSTSLTPEGYAVESENEPGSVQIYPAKALRNLSDDGETM